MNNKFTTYLLYAVGEIILVVAGILIALWIDQEATSRDERQEEQVILKEIRANLSSDLAEITQDIMFMDSVTIACDYIMRYISLNNQPDSVFGREVLKTRISTHFNFNASGYNLLASRGIKIVRNDSLRRAISYLYDSHYPYYVRYESERIDFRIYHLDPFLNSNFNWISKPTDLYLGTYEIPQEGYEELIRNGVFYKLLTSIKRENLLVKDRAKRIATDIIKLSNFIDAELKKSD